MPRAPRIAIVGGGIGGLAAALALERRGAEAIVCEQAPALSEIGAGLNLTPNAVKALRALGLDDEIEAIGSGSEYMLMRSWNRAASSRAPGAANSARSSARRI